MVVRVPPYLATIAPFCHEPKGWRPKVESQSYRPNRDPIKPDTLAVWFEGTLQEYFSSRAFRDDDTRFSSRTWVVHCHDCVRGIHIASTRRA